MPSPPPEVATATSGASARRRRPSLLVDTASRCQPGAPPPARRAQRRRLPPRDARPPPPHRPARHREAVATSPRSTVAVAAVERLHGNGVAILHRPLTSVALQSHQNRRSRNRAPEIWNLNTPVWYSKSSGQNAKSARRANRA
jgi:hypothetical protein